MEGGTISNNFAGAAGGVNVEWGHFTMHSGAVISHNNASGVGGGVRIPPYLGSATFTMLGGTITGNRSGSFGGGVYVEGAPNQAMFIMHGGHITNNSARVDGGGIFTTRHSYTDPIIPGAGSSWAEIYDNIQIGAGATFLGNTARRWFYPPAIPDNANRLPNVPWTNNTSSISSGGQQLYLLNNYDINFQQPLGTWFVGNVLGVRFPFHKTDYNLYTRLTLSGGTLTSADWTTINDDHLLAGARFEMFRWNGAAASPPAGAIVNPANPGNDWVRIWYGTSDDVIGGEMIVGLDSRDTYHQLVEVSAPIGFMTPLGQWRVMLSDSCHSPGCRPAGDGFYIRVVSIGSPIPPTFVFNPYATPHPGIWYVGNLLEFELPLDAIADKVMALALGA